jgi:curli biogenesis system outer membrane secretion channel CsgG
MSSFILAPTLVFLALGGAAPQRKPPIDPDLPVYTGPKKRAIVTAMEVKVQGVTTTAPTPSGTTTVVTLDLDQPTEFGTGLTDMLTTALVASDRFVVLERQNLEEVMREAALSVTPEFNPDTAVTAGKLLSAQVMVRGSVTELAVKKSGSDVGGVLGNTLSFGQARSEARVSIDLKIVDISTGQVLDSVKAEGKAVSSRQQIVLTSEDIKLGNASFENSPLGVAVRQAINDAVRKICSRAEKLQWEAKVAAIEEEESSSLLYLNVGAESNLRLGDVLEIYRPGEDIIDPDSKVVIGRTKGKVVGKAEVQEVQEKVTLAKSVEGSSFQRGDTVRFVRRAGGL